MTTTDLYWDPFDVEIDTGLVEDLDAHRPSLIGVGAPVPRVGRCFWIC